MSHDKSKFYYYIMFLPNTFMPWWLKQINSINDIFIIMCSRFVSDTSKILSYDQVLKLNYYSLSQQQHQNQLFNFPQIN